MAHDQEVSRRRILLIKLPCVAFPDAKAGGDRDFHRKSGYTTELPLGLAVLGAFIDKYNKLDLQLKAVDINILGYTAPGKGVDEALFKPLLLKTIEEGAYDVLALQCVFVFNHKWVQCAVEHSRRFHPKAKIVLGGGYPTLFPEKCLTDYDVDHVVIGEGESAFLHILNGYNAFQDDAFSEKFPFDGYGLKQSDGKALIVPKKQFLPGAEIVSPAWHYFDIETYFRNSGRRSITVEGCRGCPYLCTYCSTGSAWGRNIRYKQVGQLLEEIRSIVERYQPDELLFPDDNIAFDGAWFKGLLNGLIALKLPVKLNFLHFSVKHLNETVLDLLKAAHVERICFAVETGSPEVQKSIRKNLDLDQVRKVMTMIKARKLYTQICWMIGFPHETLEQVKQTLRLVKELRAEHNMFSLVVPYPGTAMFESANKDGLLSFADDSLDNYDRRKGGLVRSEQWTQAGLQNMAYEVNIDVNFLNNSYLDSEEGRAHFLFELEGLTARLPDHVIVKIVLGHLYGLKKDEPKRSACYAAAANLLRREDLRDVFGKYFEWDHPLIKEFHAARPGLERPSPEILK